MLLKFPMMKLLIGVLAVSLLSFIETKSVEDNTRKCIVKYLSDKQLLDSSFVVDSVLPDNCYELIDEKIEKLYEASYYKDINDDNANTEIVVSLLMTGMVDLVLKSDLIGDTKKADELISVFQELTKIEEFIGLWFDNTTESFKFTSSRSTKELSCLQSYLSELLDNKETPNISENNIFATQGCVKPLTSFKKSFEVELLEMLPKLSSENGQNCIIKAFTQLNMTDNFFNGYIYKTMQEEKMNYTTIESRIFYFFVPIFECVRLITKETSNNVFTIEADFNEALNISMPEDGSIEYRKTHGVIVKLNQNRQNTEIKLIANATSEVMKYSRCFLDELNHMKFKTIALRVMSVEEDFDVVTLLEMQSFLKIYVEASLAFCEPSYFAESTKTVKKYGKESIMMKCFSKFVSEEDVKGVTFFRVNIVMKPDDVKCEQFFEMQKYKSDQNICFVKRLKKMNFYNRLWTVQMIKQYDVSTQQQKELEKDANQIEREFNDSMYYCMLKDFNEI